MRQYKDDLLISCLKFLFSLPASVITNQLQSTSEALQVGKFCINSMRAQRSVYIYSQSAQDLLATVSRASRKRSLSAKNWCIDWNYWYFILPLIFSYHNERLLTLLI